MFVDIGHSPFKNEMVGVGFGKTPSMRLWPWNGTAAGRVLEPAGPGPRHSKNVRGQGYPAVNKIKK
jgi:hypothetical protein